MFSVIIPTFNRAHIIGKTLESLKNQTYRPIEIIVVDDGSTDDTRSVVQDWKKQNCDLSHNDYTLVDPSNTKGITLKYIWQENARSAAARNRGLKEITGDYVQFLDSDDQLHPKRFSILGNAFREQDADFIQTSIEWFDPETGETTRTLWARPDEDQVQLVIKGEFWANTLRSALTRNLADKIGPWDINLLSFEDREYMERAVLEARKPIALRPILGYLARGKGDHVSNTHRTREGRRFRILSERKLVERLIKRNDISADLKSMLASRIYRIGCRSAARGWYDYAKECSQIGDLLGVKLTFTAKVKRFLCRIGQIGGKIYRIVCRIKGLPQEY